MPTVIGLNQVPANIPRNTFWDQYGQLGGTMSRQVTDALLAALLGGKLGGVPTQPTPQSPGNLTFPGGASTPTSPAEMQQMQALGGAPTSQGVVPFGQPQYGGVQYSPPTKFGIKPDMQQQLDQLKMAQIQSDLQAAPTERAYKQAQLDLAKSQAKLFDRYFPTSPTTSTIPMASGGNIAQLQAIADKADAGDATAQAVMEYLLSH